MNEELEALDREWAELAGWEMVQEAPSGHAWERRIGPHQSQRIWQGLNEGVWTHNPAYCFGLGGPWEWLVNHEYFFLSVHSPTDFVCEGSHIIGVGATPFEAITRCAIEARKRTAQQ